jgi:tetratricopeptide (TPR) repeat protein
MNIELQNAIKIHTSGDLLLAKKKYEEILNLDPNNFTINHLLGGLNLQLKNFEDAINFIKKTISINPTHHAPYNNLGATYKELEKYPEAIENFNKAIKIKPDYAECYNNLAIVLRNSKKYLEAIENFNKAIRFKPNYAEAYNGMGILYFENKNFEKAEVNFKKAVLLKEKYSEAINNLGKVFQKQKKYEKALKNLNLAINFNPRLDDGSVDYLKLFINDWNNYHNSISKFKNNSEDPNIVFEPFISLNFISSNNSQKKISEKYINSRFINNSKNFQKIYNNKKIKVGYYSADFYNHATAHLMSEFFELHDRNKFEIIAFSFGPNLNDLYTTRLIKAFDKYLNVTNENDSEILKISAKEQIDIAIDLKGFTINHRLGIFVKRVAPIQVSYLGYPGTIGASFMDYIIADKIVIPEENQKHFSEKIIYLPDSYQVNDSTRKISNKKFTHKDFDLPEDHFIFCCFNNSYKINPIIFDIWMNILKKTKKSVLWLLEDNSTNKKNLQKEAKLRGVSEDRIIFARRIENSEHLARHKLADLFLDTLPYNAHTTTSDALWCGLPVLTCSGNNFQARVASSLLNAIGLPELITNSLYEYQELAIKLSNNKNITEIKNKLYNNIKSTPLFNTKNFTKYVEEAYTKIYELNQNNLKPKNIFINKII